MEGIQGAVLGVKLKYLPQWTDGKRNVAKKYREQLGSFDKVKLPTEMSYAKHVYHLYVIQIQAASDVKKNSELRDKLKDYLQEKGIATGLHYPIPLHLQECFRDLSYKERDFPETEKLAFTGLSLPMFPELTDEQISYVCDSIKEFFSKN